MSFPFLGSFYNKILNQSKLSEETRENIKEKFGDLFEPQAIANVIAAKSRGVFFGLGGRVLFDYGTDPEGTKRVIEHFTTEDFLDTITNPGFLATTYRRAWIHSIVNLSLSSFFQAITNVLEATENVNKNDAINYLDYDRI